MGLAHLIRFTWQVLFTVLLVPFIGNVYVLFIIMNQSHFEIGPHEVDQSWLRTRSSRLLFQSGGTTGVHTPCLEVLYFKPWLVHLGSYLGERCEFADLLIEMFTVRLTSKMTRRGYSLLFWC